MIPLKCDIRYDVIDFPIVVYCDGVAVDRVVAYDIKEGFVIFTHFLILKDENIREPIIKYARIDGKITIGLS